MLATFSTLVYCEAILNPPTAHRRCAIRRSHDLRVGPKRTVGAWGGECVAIICSMDIPKKMGDVENTKQQPTWPSAKLLGT